MTDQPSQRRRINPNYRQPNICVTLAEADWILCAVKIVEGETASEPVRRKAASYLKRIAKDAQLTAHNPHQEVTPK